MLGIFLFTTSSRPALGHAQPPIQWVPGWEGPSLGVKRPGHEADHYLRLLPRPWIYTHPLPQYVLIKQGIQLHGMAFSEAQWQIYRYFTFTIYVSLTKDHAVRTYWESGGIGPRILNLGTVWRWVVTFTSQPLYARCPFGRWLCVPQNRSGRGGKEKSLIPAPAGIWNPLVQPVA